MPFPILSLQNLAPIAQADGGAVAAPLDRSAAARYGARSFREKIAGAKRILIVNPRGLGDIVHSLPVMAMLKASFPDAAIDLLASAHSESLFDIVPYVSEVFSVPFYPRAKNRLQRYLRRFRVARKVRRKSYDAIINLQALDSTAASIVFSGTRHKLGLRNIGWRISMPWLYSDTVDRPWLNQPAYRFMLDALTHAGFETSGFHLGPEMVDLSRQDLPAGLRPPFFHFSPFTSDTSRQLPVAESRGLITGLLDRYPAHQVIISCSAAQREQDQIGEIVPAAAASRVRVFPGTLNLAQLARVMASAEAHIGPDTGSLHVAWLVGARTVSWYLNHESMMAWVPNGPQHRILLSLREQARIGDHETDRNKVPIQNIKAVDVLDTLAELLQAKLPPASEWPRSGYIGFTCIHSGCNAGKP